MKSSRAHPPPPATSGEEEGTTHCQGLATKLWTRMLGVRALPAVPNPPVGQWEPKQLWLLCLPSTCPPMAILTRPGRGRKHWSPVQPRHFLARNEKAWLPGVPTLTQESGCPTLEPQQAPPQPCGCHVPSTLTAQKPEEGFNGVGKTHIRHWTPPGCSTWQLSTQETWVPVPPEVT